MCWYLIINVPENGPSFLNYSAVRIVLTTECHAILRKENRREWHVHSYFRAIVTRVVVVPIDFWLSFMNLNLVLFNINEPLWDVLHKSVELLQANSAIFLSLQIIPGLSNEYIGGECNFGYYNRMIMRTVCTEAHIQVSLLTRS